MTTKYQYKLYDDLMQLVDSNEAFYYKDFEFGSSLYRIFNYRLASYTDFQAPGATECRGTMFEVEEVDNKTQMIRLAALPMEKFWNLNENPATMNLDLSSVDLIEDKADGSLISTFLHVGNSSYNSLFRLKTKGSLNSSQASAALRWLQLEKNNELLHKLRTLTGSGYTVNMEWCAPTNRIVIGYEEPHLKILNVRDTTTGEYVNRDDSLVKHNKQMQEIWIDRHDVNDPVEFVKSIPKMQNIEGFVVRLSSGQRVKIKTEWYLALHHTKDSINSPRRLYEAVLEEATDDMRSLFHDDPVAIKMIEEMEQKVDHLYNHYVDIVERFYERNKELSRKDYAILGQKELPELVFPLAMQKYLDRPVDYKSWMKRHYKDFGIKDDISDSY